MASEESLAESCPRFCADKLDEGGLALMAISKLLGPDDMEKFKVAIRGIGVSDKVRDETTFSGIFGCLADSLRKHNEDITFAYHVLKALKISLGDQEPEVEQYLIPGYDLRTCYPAVDCRLVLIEFLSSLREEDYKAILDTMCRVMKVNCCRFKFRFELAEAMFCADCIPDPTKDITQIYKIGVVYNCRQLFSEYCQRQKIQEPVVDSRLAAWSREQKLSLLLDIMRTKRRSKPRIFCILVTTIAILVAVIGSIVTGLSARYAGIIRGSVNITDYSVISLNNGFSSYYDSVTLSLVTNDDRVAVNVFVAECSQASTVTHQLTPRTMPVLLAPSFKRHPYNYNGEDTPLNALEDSYIDFNLSASSAVPNPSCLKVRIFSNFELYHDATTPGEDNTATVDGTIANSSCLPVSTVNGTSANSSWRYTFDRQRYVYATVDVDGGVTLNGVISGSVVNYTLDSLSHYKKCSPLTKDSNKCRVDMCGQTCSKLDPKPLQCVFLQIQQTSVEITSQYEISYTARLPTYKFSFFLSVGITGGLLLILLLSTVVALLLYLYRDSCCSCQHSVRTNRSFLTQHSNDSDFLLLHGHELN